MRRREAAKLFQELGKEGRLLLVLRIFFSGKRYGHHQRIVCIEARVDLLQSIEAAYQQSRSDQKHQRERDFCHNQRTANAVV